jgi:hypothetical protein
MNRKKFEHILGQDSLQKAITDTTELARDLCGVQTLQPVERSNEAHHAH